MPPSYYGGPPVQAWGSGVAMPPQIMWCPTWPLQSPMHNTPNHNKVWQ
jgi:hypothetical protein